MLNLIQKMKFILSRVLNKSNLSKILIIFIIGFVSRSVVNYVYDINVITYNINSISIIYYTFMAFVSILVHELVSYFNFPSISYEVFNISSIKKGSSVILKRFIGCENKIVLGMKSIDYKSRDNSTNKLLNIISMNESDIEDFKGGSKEESVVSKEESVLNKSSKEVKSEDVSIKEVRQYWYKKIISRQFLDRETGGSSSNSLESYGPNYPFHKEEYVRWLNGKDIYGNKIYIYDRSVYINITKEREEELLKYWRFILKDEGEPKYLPISTTSNELIESRYKVIQEIIKSKESLSFLYFKIIV